MSNLDTDNGLTTPTMAQIIQAFVTQINTNLDPSFAIADDNLLSQIIVILSQELSNLFDTLQVCFDVLDPSTAQGQNLIDAAAYIGISPRGALATQVYLLLTSATSTTFTASTSLTASGFTIINPTAYTIAATSCAQAEIQVLSAVDSAVYTIELDDIEISYTADPDDTIDTIATALMNAILEDAPLFTASINGSMLSNVIINRLTGGNIDFSQSFSIVVTTPTYIGLYKISAYGLFLNSVTGNISIPAGTFNLSSTPVAGVSTIQEIDGINGNDADTDQDLRIRRDLSLAYGGNRTIAAIRAVLLNTNYVQKAIVFQNTANTSETLNPGAVSILPHSIYAVVLGGYSGDIGNAIYKRMSEGIQTNGETAVQISDQYNNLIIVNFDYATQVPVAINVTITLDPAVFYKIDKNIVDNIKNAIFAYISGLNISETMYMWSLEGIAANAAVFGVQDVVVTYELLPSTTPLNTSLVPNVNEIIVATLANINVTVET